MADGKARHQNNDEHARNHGESPPFRKRLGATRDARLCVEVPAITL
ncbi:MAG: hypothetical protein OJF52_001154 [Nitrospira sp.]|nr:MAG: hypothetical protein OJF52_001154 [Nitrospira sp.]